MNLSTLKQHSDYNEYFKYTNNELMAKFLDYHQENQELWKLMEKFALEALKANRSRFSIWMIANRIRWYTQIETTGKELKVSNDYLALYARFLMLKHPQLKGIFRIKQMKKSNRTEAKD